MFGQQFTWATSEFTGRYITQSYYFRRDGATAGNAGMIDALWQTENIPITFIHKSRDNASVPFYQISPDINWFMNFGVQQLMSIDDSVITWTNKTTGVYVILDMIRR